MIDISVIVLTYNSADYIQDCLRSLERSCRHFKKQVIIVDNNSTDNTLEIAGTFSDVDIVNVVNTDIGMARNIGFRYVRGKFLCFLDSDDRHTPDRIDTHLRLLYSHKKTDLIIGMAEIYYSQQEKPGVKNFTQANNPLQLSDYLYGKCYSLGAITFRTDSLSCASVLFEEGILGCLGEDWYYQLQISLSQLQAMVLPMSALSVIIRSDSHTQWETQRKLKAATLYHISKYYPESIATKSHILLATFKYIASKQLAHTSEVDTMMMSRLKMLSAKSSFLLCIYLLSWLRLPIPRALLTSLWLRLQMHSNSSPIPNN